MDLVRTILLAAEDAPPGGSDLEFEGHDLKTVAYHVDLLEEAGYLVGDNIRSEGGVVGAGVERLTWEGHEFLDAVRDDTVWRRTKERVSRAVGSASIEVVKAVAEGIAKGQLGL